MRRPALTSILTVVAYAIAVAAIIFGFVVQAQRIGTAEALADHRLSVIQDKEAQLGSLLDKYAALADDCEEAADCSTTTPPVEVIERTLTVEGLPGPAGPGATSDQIAEGIRAYCGSRDDCRGPKGDTGTPGADSTVPGPPGAASTVPGPAGADGRDGRSVTDNQCIGVGDASYWQTTYSDGTSTTSPGPCRLAPVPGLDL